MSNSSNPSDSSDPDALIEEIRTLRMRNEQYRLLLDESSDPIFSFTPDGRYLYVNQAFAKGTGRLQQDIIGHAIWDIFSQDEADKRFAVIKWVFANRQPKEIEVRVPRPEGDHYYLTTAKPILADSGEVRMVICISKEITERKHMEDRLAHMAQYDPLTELPNRSLVSELLLQAMVMADRNRTRLGLMYLDLDRFKPVNDNYGHHIGDQLLQAAAKRMRSCLRESDTVGRIGGDEFVVLLPVIEQNEDALVVAEKIRIGLETVFDLPEHPGISISSSIGIAFYPDHADNETTLLKQADQALYRAKALGRNQTQIFAAA